MSQRSILFIEHSSVMGGGQTILLTLLDAALEAFSSVTLLAPCGGTLEEVIQNNYVSRVTIVDIAEPKLTHGRKSFFDLIRLFFYSLGFVKFWSRFRQSNIIYVNGTRYFPAACMLSLLTWRRCCYHVHLAPTGPQLVLLSLMERLPTTARIVVSSPFILRKIAQRLSRLASSRKVTVLENGLSTAYSSQAFRDRFAGHAPALRAMVLGVLRQEKGQDAAIEAARRLPNLRLFLIGRDGPGAEHWIEAQKKSAPPGVIFYGETKSVAETIDAEDIALNLVPSRWEEPFGLVALEGMACSCLTIVRAVAGLKDIADVTGALTFQNDSELPALIGRILETDSKDLAALARAQYEATMSVYTAEGFRARALSLLQSLTHPVNPAQYRQPGLTVGKPPKE